MFGRKQGNAYFHSGYMQQRQSGMNPYFYPQSSQNAPYNDTGGNPGYYQQNSPYPNIPFNGGWQSYQQPNNFYPSQFPQGPQFQSGIGQNHFSHYSAQPKKDAQFLFQNPLQSQEDILHPHYQEQQNVFPNANPYPKQIGIQKQPGGVKSLMNSFKGQDGSVDLNKMMDTAGQMMNAVNQVSSLVKGFGGMFKV
jgi:hypothetical protein